MFCFWRGYFNVLFYAKGIFQRLFYSAWTFQCPQDGKFRYFNVSVFRQGYLNVQNSVTDISMSILVHHPQADHLVPHQLIRIPGPVPTTLRNFAKKSPCCRAIGASSAFRRDGEGRSIRNCRAARRLASGIAAFNI